MPIFQVTSGSESYLIIARNHAEAFDTFENNMDEEMLEDMVDPAITMLAEDADLMLSDAWLDFNIFM